VSEFLLEIGAENIPASYVPPALAQLREDASALLERNRLEFDQVETTGTPRRLTLIVHGLAERQTAGEEVLTGPPVSRAFNEDGSPTPAAQGFARSQGVAVEKLDRIATPKGEYLGVRKRLPSRKAAAVLEAELPALIAGLRFPKTMKWESSGARFARPVRWIVALFDKQEVRVTFAGVKSGRVTWKRPWMRGEHASIADAKTYRAKMKSLGVIVDPQTRREKIRSLAESAARRLKLRLVPDEDLLTELTFMTEDPRVLVGSFEREYLELPAEVVVTAMRAHQRYIALTDSRGNLSPRFITFTDGPVKGPKDVVLGNERVLRARLADARFYWSEDLKHGVDALADELDRIVFIEGLGTIGQKWRRVLDVARAINQVLPAKQRVGDAVLERAARLMKADLASTMIRDGKEFTALQGIIGARYAAAAGEDAAVAEAIREHDLPRAAGDPLPESTAGRVFALADRLDTLAGCFMAGLKPSGSQDPYALRRSGNGVVRLAAAMEAVSLDSLIDRSGKGYGTTLTDEEVGARWIGKAAGADLAEFLRGRAEAYLKENGVPYDVAAAVLAADWARPGVARRRADALATLRGDATFERLITGVKRVGNILPKDRRRLGASWEDIHAAVSGSGAFPFDPARFQDEAETGLLKAVRATIGPIETADGSDRPERVLRGLSGLADPIDRYFERVLVNAEDPALRDARHALLAAVFALFGRFADFQAIVEQGAAGDRR
jgi:glycyl-tRNA synthetase beta chain